MHFEPAVNTKRENKREMTINLPNLFWQKYLSESAGNGVLEPPGNGVSGQKSTLGLRTRLTAMRSKIPTRYCPKVGHSALFTPYLICAGQSIMQTSVKMPQIILRQRIILSSHRHGTQKLISNETAVLVFLRKIGRLWKESRKFFTINLVKMLTLTMWTIASQSSISIDFNKIEIHFNSDFFILNFQMSA